MIKPKHRSKCDTTSSKVANAGPKSKIKLMTFRDSGFLKLFLEKVSHHKPDADRLAELLGTQRLGVEDM